MIILYLIIIRYSCCWKSWGKHENSLKKLVEKVSFLFVLAEDEEHSGVTDGQNGAGNVEEEPAAVVSASSSAGAHSEIDAKLADFFNVRKLISEDIL